MEMDAQQWKDMVAQLPDTMFVQNDVLWFDATEDESDFRFLRIGKYYPQFRWLMFFRSA